MKKYMNTLLIIGGIACVIIGIARALTGGEARPRHGDKRIVQDGDMIWTEDYNAFPGWSRRDRFATLEAAKDDKARWDAIHNRDENPPRVIVAQ